MLKPLPLMLPLLIETAAVPVFDSVTVVEALLFTATLPKPTLDGLALSAPCVAVPTSGTDSAPFVAVEAIVMLPETVVDVVGAYEAEKLAVLPAAIVWPALIPLVRKPEPVVDT